MGSVAKITLDADTFKALASSTRLTVLRALDVRRKTLTELAKDLALNKATVHEHLQILTQSGLVAKKDEGRKWIYYELTWRGQKILHPQETTTFSVLLGLGVLSAGGGMAMLGRALDWWLQEHPLLDDPAGLPQPEDAGPRVSSLAADTVTSGTSTAAAPGASTATYASSGSYASSTAPATSTSAPPAMGDAGDAGSSKLAALPSGTQPPAETHGVDFWADGGWLALALAAFSALSVTLAVLLRRRLRPARGVPPPPGEETEAP